MKIGRLHETPRIEDETTSGPLTNFTVDRPTASIFHPSSYTTSDVFRSCVTQVPRQRAVSLGKR